LHSPHSAPLTRGHGGPGEDGAPPSPGKGLEFSPEAMEAILADVVRAYPEEACGLLLSEPGHPARIRSCRALPNTERNDRRSAFRISPSDFRDAEVEAEMRGATIQGVYHSHPDGASIPSAEDRFLAWPGFTYLIVPVDRRGPGTAELHVADEVGRLRPGPLIVKPPIAAHGGSIPWRA
jgi:proteasome lid subunit RPN8/RPN11